jgi:hypothetical protein
MAMGAFEEDKVTVLEALIGWFLFAGFAQVGQVDELVKDAAEAPKVRRLVVLFLEKCDFGCSVPPRADVG